MMSVSTSAAARIRITTDLYLGVVVVCRLAGSGEASGSMSVRERESRGCYRQPPVQFQCSIKNLQDLMQARGMEAFVKLQQDFGGVIELCRRLYTSPTEGQYLRLIVELCHALCP